MDQIGNLLGTLMQSRNQVHIYHLQTSSPGSYAQHVALQEYYEEIVPIIDTIAEGYQGKYGIIKGYKMEGVIKEDSQPVLYFHALAKFIETLTPQLPQDSFLQNELDTLLLLVYKTKYKLENLM
jgi:hypothetical protein